VMSLVVRIRLSCIEHHGVLAALDSPNDYLSLFCALFRRRETIRLTRDEAD
jgi:hypothetical protein